jgi:Helicase subunit of the DNA excision repair complex
VEFFGDEIERIVEIDTTTGEVTGRRSHVAVFPATHYATGREKMVKALDEIQRDMEVQEKLFLDMNRPLEAERIRQRVTHDIEMMQEIGFCSGIENYSRYFDGRRPGEPPYTLIDYFPKDFLMFIDESHVTIPQIGAMYRGDRARKDALVEYGFRLPAARDNRPLTFDEFYARVPQIICVSATPGKFELSEAGQIAEQIIRPTGLVDPKVEIRPIKGQIDDLLSEVRIQTAKGYRTLVTTLTKRMAENLTEYLDGMHVRVRYMHSDIDTLDRMEIIRDLRLGAFDVLVGINLLREGLDLPEVGLVAILDADKEGFLRSETSLIQTIGRAARNAQGRVVMYADTQTDSMKNAISETARRRAIQQAYNEANGITPQTVQKAVRDLISISKKAEQASAQLEKDPESMSEKELAKLIADVEKQMRKAAAQLDFESAVELRDRLFELKKLQEQMN